MMYNETKPFEYDSDLKLENTTIQVFNSCTSQPDVCQCPVVQTHMENKSKNKPSISMTHVACESKLCSVVRSSLHPCAENWVAIGCAVVYNDRAAQAISTGIKCRHCVII